MNPVIGLSLGRIVVGAVSLATESRPGCSSSTRRQPQVPYVARLFGSREIALGSTTLAHGADPATW